MKKKIWGGSNRPLFGKSDHVEKKRWGGVKTGHFLAKVTTFIFWVCKTDVHWQVSESDKQGVLWENHAAERGFLMKLKEKRPVGLWFLCFQNR